MQNKQSVPRSPQISPILPMTPAQKRMAMLQLVFIGVGWKKYATYFLCVVTAGLIVFMVLGDGLKYVFQQHVVGEIARFDESPAEKGGIRVSFNAPSSPQIAIAQFQDQSGLPQSVKSEIAFAPPVYELHQSVTIVYPSGQPQKAKIYAWPEYLTEGGIFLFCIFAFIALRLLDALWNMPFWLYEKVRYPHGR
jgi:hypothetical protein